MAKKKKLRDKLIKRESSGTSRSKKSNEERNPPMMGIIFTGRNGQKQNKKLKGGGAMTVPFDGRITK